MFIRFPDEIKSRSTGSTPVTKEKCYPGSLRLKRWEGSHKMRRKADRCNPNASEGKIHALAVSSKRGEIQETVIQRAGESGHAAGANVSWGCLSPGGTSPGAGEEFSAVEILCAGLCVSGADRYTGKSS